MKRIVVCCIAVASLVAIAAAPAPPGWLSPWASYCDVISEVSRGIVVEQLPDSKMNKELLAALSGLLVWKTRIIPRQPGANVEKVITIVDESLPPDDAAYEKALKALEAIEKQKGSDCTTQVVKSYAVVLGDCVRAMSSAEHYLSAAVDKNLAQSEKREKQGDCDGAMRCLFRARLCKRKSDIVEERMRECVRRNNEREKAAQKDDNAIAEPIKDDIELSPQLIALVSEALQKGISKELLESVDEEANAYWKERLGISRESIRQALEKGSYELPIKYLAATSQNDLSEECAKDVLVRLNTMVDQKVTVVISHLQSQKDWLRAVARRSLQKARDEGDEASWNHAKEAFTAYEGSVRGFAGWNGYDPKSDSEEIEKTMREIDSHLGHGQ
jgi:hypothetical protein